MAAAQAGSAEAKRKRKNSEKVSIFNNNFSIFCEVKIKKSIKQQKKR